ncbi:MAG TPA: hypothetical protein VGM03_14480 [Phycisphaerae bacterium]|jgi:outer membrane protein assembly factor BamE (lipoprotein component of BamABCDE complex)|nr:hypothetical protein [Burkholderiales bacterium]
MKRLFGCGIGTALLLLVGCDKLTRNHFEMIQQGVSDKDDVERTIGKPDHVLDDQWHYERVDKHLNVQVDFDERGLVSRKQWIDATTGEWSDTTTPPADQSTRESTRIRRSKD